MTTYRFSLIVAATLRDHDEIIDASDALGEANCLDASIRGHVDGMDLLFGRTAESLENAISSAIANVESAGFRVVRVEMEREVISL